MGSYQIGMVGLAVMGRNLALNFMDKGFSLAGYNRNQELVTRLLEEAGADKRPDGEARVCGGASSLEELCGLLEKPRKIILMVKAGEPVDLMIKGLLPHLAKGDILMDAGNSYFKDTIRREMECREAGINFIGMGVSSRWCTTASNTATCSSSARPITS